MQQAIILGHSFTVNVELPSPDREVVPGVRWGAIDAFPTPAYWAYQVIARRIEDRTIRYKLGATLAEEVGACLLGGHGIPAKVGLEAFASLKSKGAFKSVRPSELQLRAWLAEPLEIDGRQVRYRFAAQKSKYLAASLEQLENEEFTRLSGRHLRDRLTSLPGIGYKTASWIARNWSDADDVAILDIHILRAGVIAGFLDPDLTVERHYLALEEQFLAFSRGLGVRASELDAVIWLEMMSAPRSVGSMLNELPASRFKTKHVFSRRADNRQPNTAQLPLIA
jgi:N-glycosylase/DNA lyase